MLRGLASFDLLDAYRSIHGYENGSTEEAWSWQVQKHGVGKYVATSDGTTISLLQRRYAR